MQKAKKSSMRSLYFSERINEAMKEITNYPLTIIEAPMGYGKTTAVREQLGLLKANDMWQRVSDNSLNSFWRGFCKLFRSLDEERFQSLLQLQFPNDSVSLETALNIIEQINLPADLIIVIDDYHIAECTETNSFLESLLSCEMMDIHIVLITRYTHFPRLEELKLKEYLHHIEKEAFELLPKDIKAYYKQCGIILNTVEADKLYSFTEGWISALYLLMLDYTSGVGPIHADDIFQLIDKVIYEPLPQLHKDFLLFMCTFDSFTSKQAAFIWKGEHSSEIIDEMVSKNAFIFYDFIEKKYYMHSILKNFLVGKLEGTEKSCKVEVYKAAAEWFAKNEEYLSSMHYAYLADDFDTLMKIIEIDKGRCFNNEHKALLINYFSECPRQIKQKYPFAMLIYIRRMFTFNEIDLFRKACAEFMESIHAMDNLDPDYRQRLLGEFELVLSFSGYNDIEKMSEYHRRASKLLKAPSSILDGTASWTFGSPSVLYMFYRKSGELEKEVQTIIEAMPFYYAITNNHGKGAELVMEAERYYFTGNFENSEITMHKAYLAATECIQSGIIISSVFLQIRLAFIKGDFPKIEGLFKQLREDINNKKWYLFIHTLDMCEAYIYSCLHISENIPAWIKNGEFKNSRLFFPSIAFLNIVYGRVLLINGEYLKLIGSSQHFINMASVFPNLLGQIYTYIYLAAANRQIFRQNDARDAIKSALSIAMPDKVYMPFVENCDYIKPLLEELYNEGSYREEIEQIFKIYMSYNSAVEHIKNSYFTHDKLVLTEREKQIAQLAASGYSNREIGERLFISPNTVKTQLKSVFDKFGINSRALLKQHLNNKEA